MGLVGSLKAFFTANPGLQAPSLEVRAAKAGELETAVINTKSRLAAMDSDAKAKKDARDRRRSAAGVDAFVDQHSRDEDGEGRSALAAVRIEPVSIITRCAWKFSRVDTGTNDSVSFGLKERRLEIFAPAAASLCRAWPNWANRDFYAPDGTVTAGVHALVGGVMRASIHS